MNPRVLNLKSAIIVAVDILVAVFLLLNLASLIQDINVIRVPARLFAFISYFGFGIVLSAISLLGSIKLLKISQLLINIFTLSSIIILLLNRIFVIIILPYE